MKSVLQAEDTEGERHISISTLLIFNLTQYSAEN